MQKVTEEELKQVEKIKQQALEIASILGELSYQKILIENQMEEQRAKITNLKYEESKVFEQLREKYGNVTINIETGEFS
jgi:hypothetical protein